MTADFYRYPGLILATWLTMTACGGLDREDESDTSFRVNAGLDQTVEEQTTVTLSATTSNATGTVNYTWTATPTLTISQDDTTSASAYFTTPAVTELTTYTLRVSATDENSTTTDTLVVSVTSSNIAPIAYISVDQWPELTANTFPAGVEITLDGRDSSDEDSSDSQQPISHWLWQQESGTDVISNLTSTQSTLSFTTPIADEGETLVFALTVTDDEGATDTANISLRILSASDTQPTVSSGYNQKVYSGEMIILAGDAASSVPAAYPLQTTWTDSTSSATLATSPTSLSTYAVAPQVTEDTEIDFNLTIIDNYGNTISDAISVLVSPFPTPLINDTGVSFQATDDSNTTTQQNDWPGQDGHKGGDVIANNDQAVKAGRGLAGFDFTKLNANGDAQDVDSTEFSCTRDNITGLIWEVKTDDDGLHDKDNLYSWYQTDSNGGYIGDDSGTTACTLTECNTQAYVTAVNSTGLCGYHDWRLPTHTELLSIVHFGSTTSPRVDTTFFVNTGTSSELDLWYWTNQPGADGVSADAAQNAWAIDFVSGVDNFLAKSTPAYVRLVRAGR
jgi:hypothetical protein